jgi:hypothetical protein
MSFGARFYKFLSLALNSKLQLNCADGAENYAKVSWVSGRTQVQINTLRQIIVVKISLCFVLFSRQQRRATQLSFH